MSKAGDIGYQSKKNTTINHCIRIRGGIAWQGMDALAFGCKRAWALQNNNFAIKLFM